MQLNYLHVQPEGSSNIYIINIYVFYALTYSATFTKVNGVITQSICVWLRMFI